MNLFRPIYLLLCLGCYFFMSGNNALFAEECDTAIFSNIAPEICQGEVFTVGSNNYSASGVYIDTLLSFEECDSIITTNLTVRNGNVLQQSVRICAGQSFQVGNSVYTTAGQYRDSLLNTFGCDSIVFTNIGINPTFGIIQDISICAGESVQVGGNTYSEAGTYIDTLKTIFFCDSIITTNLSVTAAVVTNLSIELCEGQSFQVGNSVYSSSGNYIDTLLSSGGCDSIINLNLNILPTAKFSQNPEICQGESVSVGNSIYTAPGTYIDTLISSSGCDSIITTTLTVNPIFSSVQTRSICQGESIIVGTNSYNTTGTYIDTLNTLSGCDSIITTNLTVRPVFRRTDNPQICSGQVYNVGNNSYTATGTYIDSLSTVFGCDSIITTNLSVVGALVSNVALTLCEGQSVQVGNSIYDESGNYTDTLSSASGCDSIVNLNLSILPKQTFQQSVSICVGQSITVGNNTYTSAGIYVDTLSSSFGCDSIVTTTLSLLPTFTGSATLTICEGESIQVGTNVYTVSGTYTDTLLTAAGCDSIIITNLTVRPVFRRTDNPQICSGQVYNVGNNSYTATGTYIDSLSTVFGCDSIITTNLSVVGALVLNIALTLCEGQSVQVGNSIYDESGNYTDTLSSASGCDSIVNLNLSILPKQTFQQSVSICVGQSITVGNNTYTSAGIYVDTLSSSFGCDSIVTTTLSLLPTFTGSATLTLCEGDSIQVGTNVYTVSGTYTDTLLTAAGCDSIIITNLTVNPVFRRTDNPQICSGQVYNVGNSNYTASGTYIDSLSTVFGCDSIITTNLLVVSEIVVNLNISICEGDSFQVDNSTYFEAGTYIDTLSSTGGCDSIVVTNLSLDGVITVNFEAAICQGDFLEFGDTILSTAGVYTQIIPNENGCDSIATLTLTINPDQLTDIDIRACQGDTIVIEGQNYTQSINVTINKFTYQGCDSTVRYSIIFNPRNLVSEDVIVCLPGTFQGLPITKDTIIVRVFENSFGCDSIITYNIRAALPANTEALSSICFGASYEGFTIRQDTVIVKALSTIFGCDSIVTEFITALPLPSITVSRDTTVNPGSSVTLFASGAANYQWSTGQTSPVISVAPTESTNYIVRGFGENGCSDCAVIRITVNACQIKVPTLFTPNNDGIHDFLSVKGAECLSVFSMAVLNRWGDVIFETQDINKLWDGTRNGSNLPEGVYYYILSGTSVVDGFPVLEKGYVHLKR
jgi:gliding motility-associated-like protein